MSNANIGLSNVWTSDPLCSRAVLEIQVVSGSSSTNNILFLLFLSEEFNVVYPSPVTHVISPWCTLKYFRISKDWIACFCTRPFSWLDPLLLFVCSRHFSYGYDRYLVLYPSSILSPVVLRTIVTFQIHD